jgi:hypothetical protein
MEARAKYEPVDLAEAGFPRWFTWSAARLPEDIPEATCDRAIAEGAALYRCDKAFEEDDLPPDPESSCFMSITWREYWEMYPDELPAPLPPPQWRLRLLLTLDSPWFRLRTPAGEVPLDFQLHGLYLQAPPEKELYCLLLLEADPEAPPPEAFQVTGMDGEGPAGPWQLSPGTRLEAAPPPPGAQRGWDWAWSHTCGPVYIKIHLQRTAEELRQWFNQLRSRDYGYTNSGLYWPREILGEPGSLAARYLPLEENAYHFISPYETETWGRDLYLRDGEIMLLHSYSYAVWQWCADSTMLASILAGDLGEVICWKVMDGDYGYCDGGGRGTESLRRYLSPDLPEAALREEVQSGLKEVKVPITPTRDQLLASVGEQLAAGRPTLEWLTTTDPATLPWAVSITVDGVCVREVADEVRALLYAARPEIFWRLGHNSP